MNRQDLAANAAGSRNRPEQIHWHTGLVTFLLLLTNSNAIVLPVVLVLLAIKLYSSLRILRLHEPIERQHGPGRGGASASNRPS